MSENLRNVLHRSQEIERLLKAKGAQGNGMGEYAHSLKDQLSPIVFQDIMFMVRWRNRFTHDNVDYFMPQVEVEKFNVASERAADALGGRQSGQTTGTMQAVLTLAHILLTCLWGYGVTETLGNVYARDGVLEILVGFVAAPIFIVLNILLIVLLAKARAGHNYLYSIFSVVGQVLVFFLLVSFG